jgi:hypothetical protein
MANTPPIFQYSNYPSSYDYNDGKIVKSNHEIIKKIEIEKNFSDYVSLDMKSKRYGINPCCTFDQLESSIIKKEVCEWQDKVKPIFTKEYDNIVWPLNTEPVPEWVQWGDYDPSIGPCIQDDCRNYKDPYGSSEWFSLRINMDVVQARFTPDATWDGTGVLNPEPINQSGTAVLYVLSTRNTDGTGWQVVGKSKIPAGPTDDTLGDGGNIITDLTTNEDFWRIQIYYNLPSTPINDGASAKDFLKFVVVQPDIHYEVKFNAIEFATANGSEDFNDYHLFPNVTYGVPGSAAATAETTIQDTARFKKICDKRFVKCQYCGMEAVYENLTTIPDNSDDLPVGFRCADDSECLYIHVTNQFGVSIENYPIILDGIDVGVTDVNGVYKHKFINASIDNKHTINICDFCFYTTGECNQQYISIVVNDTRFAAYCAPDTPSLVCSDVFPDIQVADGDEPEDTVTSWLCDNDGTNYYGCVEIIGSYGFETQAECEESCVAPEIETHYRCNQMSSGSGTSGSFCQQIPGPYAGGNNYYETLEECEEGCTDTIVTGCWECSGAPGFIAQWNEAATPNSTDCFGTMTGFNSAVAAGTFCQVPPRYLFTGCDCEESQNTEYIFPNNGVGVGVGQQVFGDYDACYTWGQENCKYSNNNDDTPDEANWVTDVIGVIDGSFPTNYPYYTDANIPSTLLDAYNVFNQITAGETFLGPSNSKLLMIPVYWPGTAGVGDSSVQYRIGSNFEFTIYIEVDNNDDDSGNQVVQVFGANGNWANDDLVETDHEELFYIVNKQEGLTALGLGTTSMAGGNEYLTDYYQNNGSDEYIDYISVTNNPNQSNGSLGTGWNGQSVRQYWYDVKFDYDLAISQGGLNPNQMPLMNGRMFYIPVYLQVEEFFGTVFNALNNNFIINFIPPNDGEFYGTAVDGTTGESVDYGIIGGSNGEFLADDAAE